MATLSLQVKEFIENMNIEDDLTAAGPLLDSPCIQKLIDKLSLEPEVLLQILKFVTIPELEDLT